MKTVKSNVRSSLCQRKGREKGRVGTGAFARPAERSEAHACAAAMPEFSLIFRQPTAAEGLKTGEIRVDL
jgi:hypothetical protein